MDAKTEPLDDEALVNLVPSPALSLTSPLSMWSNTSCNCLPTLFPFFVTSHSLQISRQIGFWILFLLPKGKPKIVCGLVRWPNCELVT